jgi:hypothetical protein
MTYLEVFEAGCEDRTSPLFIHSAFLSLPDNHCPLEDGEWEGRDDRTGTEKDGRQRRIQMKGIRTNHVFVFRKAS